MKIPKEVLSIRAAAATEPGRYTVNGVHFRRKGKSRPCAVATNGKILVWSSWKDDGDGEINSILHTDQLDQVARFFKKKDIRPAASFSKKVVKKKSIATISVPTEKDIVGEELEGIFPIWQKVIPKCLQFGTIENDFKTTFDRNAKFIHANFSVDNLVTLATTLKKITGKNGITIRFQIMPKMKPCVLFLPKLDGTEKENVTGHSAVGIIMLTERHY